MRRNETAQSTLWCCRAGTRRSGRVAPCDEIDLIFIAAAGVAARQHGGARVCRGGACVIWSRVYSIDDNLSCYIDVACHDVTVTAWRRYRLHSVNDDAPAMSGVMSVFGCSCWAGGPCERRVLVLWCPCYLDFINALFSFMFIIK
jgi:hypothetical protein